MGESEWSDSPKVHEIGNQSWNELEVCCDDAMIYAMWVAKYLLDERVCGRKTFLPIKTMNYESSKRVFVFQTDFKIRWGWSWTAIRDDYDDQW